MKKPFELAFLSLSALVLACAGEASTEASAAPLPAPRLESTLTTRVEQEPASAGVVTVPRPEAEEVELQTPELHEGPIHLRRLVVATGVSDREPTGVADSFGRDLPRLYAFLEAVNQTDEPVALVVTFEPEGGEPVGHVSLAVPARARRFRTWAHTQHAKRAGRWEVVVRTPDGTIIARRPFEIVG